MGPESTSRLDSVISVSWSLYKTEEDGQVPGLVLSLLLEVGLVKIKISAAPQPAWSLRDTLPLDPNPVGSRTGCLFKRSSWEEKKEKAADCWICFPALPTDIYEESPTASFVLVLWVQTPESSACRKLPVTMGELQGINKQLYTQRKQFPVELGL